MPHEGSKYHDNTLYDELSLDIGNIKNKYDLPILLMGDFNSRTSNANDIMMIEAQDNILDASNFKYPNFINVLNSLGMPVKRTSKDTFINNNGWSLIKMCKIQELCILNGRAGLDRNIGSLTCADASIVDYMICTPDLLHKIAHCDIDIFDPLLSDKHKPIQLSINMEENITHEVSSIKEIGNSTKECITKCKWNDDKKDEYQMNFDERKINHIFDVVSSANAIETTQNSMDNIVNELKEIFLEPAKVTGMFTQHNISTNNRRRKCNNAWYNNECDASKKDYKKFKKSLNKNQKDEKKKMKKKRP